MRELDRDLCSSGSIVGVPSFERLSSDDWLIPMPESFVTYAPGGSGRLFMLIGGFGAGRLGMISLTGPEG